MRHGRKFRLRALTVVVIAGLSTAGLAATGAGAQTEAVPGVTAKTVKLGFISAETGVASSTGKDGGKACKARIDAQNAKGGVHGRKIELEAVDDQSSGAQVTATKDLAENRKVFAVINNSAFAYLSYRYLKAQGVPSIGAGFDGTYYYDKGNENIISGIGDQTPLPGLTYDTATQVMKQLGATKVASVAYGVSPASTAAATDTNEWAAPASGLEDVYLNTALEFGTTDVGPVVLGIKNSGADGLYLPLDSDTNFAIVLGLQQNGVKMKANVLATGYSPDLLGQPIAQTIQPSDVMFSQYRPIELGGKAVKQFRANLKKVGITGIPRYGAYTAYIACDLAITGLLGAGKDLTRQGWIDGIRNSGPYNGAGLLCQTVDYKLANFGKIAPSSCAWFVNVKNGKFNVLNKGKPITGKLVGDPALIAQYKRA